MPVIIDNAGAIVIIFSPQRSGRKAFTLIELLTVLAVIGLLVAILIPTVSSARRAALKTKTRVQFSQWTLAIESFRREYGYYPSFAVTGLVNPTGQSTDAALLHLFHDVLAARRRDGSTFPAYITSTSAQAPEAQNRRLIPFYTFGEQELTADHLIRDAFDNTQIAVIVDKNLDGVITIGTGGDYASLPAVAGMQPAEVDFPTTGLRTGVAFYVPAPGATSDAPGLILSWK